MSIYSQRSDQKALEMEPSASFINELFGQFYWTLELGYTRQERSIEVSQYSTLFCLVSNSRLILL
ncbi:hypothetical protein VCRA2123O444_100152 [Vibrio crassostreae]|nr:hypothetical protein VCRA2114O422_100004 [Vibrio crassostreae]CAK1705533.1 hypothetical protein VCRA2119O431_100150 [Vibrio crassostreae]CAK1710388.1 hypothetical protein VCRA2113O409_110004 [Vibrio crassostreae]CAK1710593.1 hypothetical protein VCRA2119O430_110004 [Vibrio crassostreae]CAK1729012.1 hypothetical protein VCRA2118O429_120004 [Vibrio crassostreae]